MFKRFWTIFSLGAPDKQRRFWTTHVNRKWGYQICISKCLYNKETKIETICPNFGQNHLLKIKKDHFRLTCMRRSKISLRKLTI